jgi:hypothetical protein
MIDGVSVVAQLKAAQPRGGMSPLTYRTANFDNHDVASTLSLQRGAYDGLGRNSKYFKVL